MVELLVMRVRNTMNSIETRTHVCPSLYSEGMTPKSVSCETPCTPELCDLGRRRESQIKPIQLDMYGVLVCPGKG